MSSSGANGRELVLLAEMHSDVLATAAENLLPAVDFVKCSVLKGKAYRAEDFATVSLELRKFLAASTDEQKRVLASQNVQLQADAQVEREVAARSRKAQEDAESTLLAREEEIDEQAWKLDSSVRENVELRATLNTLQHRQRLAAAVIGTGVGSLMWIFRLPLAEAIGAKIGFREVVDVCLHAVAGFVFCFPALYFVRRGDWRTEVKLGVGALIIFAGIWTTRVIEPSIAANVASYLAIATAVAGVVVFPWKS